MLPLPNLNEQDLNSILQNTIQAVYRKEDVWQDWDIHDPGVTFLELFTVLKQEQMQQMNTITMRSLEKYLKLLQIKRQQNQCARTRVCLRANKETWIPEGYTIGQEDIPYEVAQAGIVLDNEILAYGNGDTMTCSYLPYQQEQIQATVFTQKRDCFYIGFQHPLPENVAFRLYFALEPDPVLQRNPLQEGYSPLSAVVWEYFDQNTNKWEALEVQQDETMAFLYSGTVILYRKGGAHGTPFGQALYAIRARCIRYGYEKSPMLAQCLCNSFDLIQQQTKCRSVFFSLEAFEKNEMMVQSMVAGKEQYKLYIRNENGWKNAKDAGIAYMLLEPTLQGRRLATSDRQKLFDAFSGMTSDTNVFLLLLYQQDFASKRILGISNGAIHQEYSVPLEKNAVYDSFSLMVQEKQNASVWEKVESLDGCNNIAPVYMLHAAKAAVRFGDHHDGKAPAPNSQIILTSFATTKLAQGNIQAHVLDGILPDGIQVWQYQNGIGGKDAESKEELLMRIRTCMDTQKRAVTAEDYRTLAMQTPGLCMGQVTVLPLYRPHLKRYPQVQEENAVTLVIAPSVFTQNQNAIQGYLQTVRQYMEQFRLITTKLYVMAVEYIPIDIEMEIRIEQNQIHIKEKLQKTVSDYIEACQKNIPGAFIYYGELYGLLESVPMVNHVKYLQMESGVSVEKNEFGDIRVPHYAHAYLRNCSITFF